MRKQFILLALLLCAAMSASARVNVSIGIHVPVYPRLVQVPSYPVYYAPDLDSNYFFYDDRYWVYQDDGWYASEWYDGPWEYVDPEYVPYFILRVPVRYYRLPPRYFIGWQFDAPPRWHVHWGSHWANRHRGWNHWDRRHVPAPAPLPVYQRNYSGSRYPRHREQQHVVRERHDSYRLQEGRSREAVRHDYRGNDQQQRRGDRQFFDRNDRRNDERRNDERRNGGASRQFTASPERQLMPPQNSERREHHDRREFQMREPSPDRRAQMQQQPRRAWNGQRQPSQREQMPAPQQREQRQFSQPRSSEQGNQARGDRGRGNGGERNHDRGGRGDRGDRGDRGRDRA